MRSLPFFGLCALLLAACNQTSTPLPAGAVPDAVPSPALSAQAVLAWPAVRTGSSGRDVVTAQYLLREAGQTVTVDGAFGSGTETAVRNFQGARGLTADGVVGSNTWEALIKTVRQGDSNNAVRAVQDQLRSGYGYTSLTVDGVFGTGTLNAVKDFQSKRGLSADGVVGLNTWHALVSGASGTVSGTTAGLAQQLLSFDTQGRIVLGRSSSTPGGSPYQNLVDTANGRATARGCAGNAACGLTTTIKRELLEGMVKIVNAGHSYTVTAIAGGVHSANSDHYAGLAFDIGTFDGVFLGSPNSGHIAARNTCIAQGSNPSQTFNYTNDSSGAHNNHVHCSWN